MKYTILLISIILLTSFNQVNFKKSSQEPTYLYVSAKSGLNFREKPKGKILGKFSLNTYVKVVEKTSITESIKDEGKIIKGTWVGVENQQDTVYVFDGFLSKNKVLSDIKLYYASAIYKSRRNEYRTGFVNLSDSFFRYEYDAEGKNISKPVLEIYNGSKDTISLNKKQRSQFLKRVSVKETDSLFIYNIKNDKVTSFLIRNLPAITCINIYFSSREFNREEIDYEFGFDLGNSFKIDYNFVFIGKKNPFTKGQLKPIIWKKTTDKKFQSIISNNKRATNLKESLQDFKLTNIFKFSKDNLQFYLLEYYREPRGRYRLLIVLNKSKQQVIYSEIQKESEGISFNPIRTKENSLDYLTQFAGKLFKNKPTVFFGFLNYSFSCPLITVLDKTEPEIPILCDNRH